MKREGGREKFKPSSYCDAHQTPVTSHGSTGVKETFKNKTSLYLSVALFDK